METVNKTRKLAILGSTGSIGCQTLDIVRAYPDIFSAEILTSNTNSQLLIKQALEFDPDTVVIGDEKLYQTVRDALAHTDVKVFAGDQSICDVTASSQIDTVMLALVGFAGLKPALHAIRNGKHLALATKEVLVVAGEQIISEAKKNDVAILPVDSEHSAILQCIVGEQADALEKIILTASGGPFIGYSLEQLNHVTLADALKHPNWSMGKKITIDSATMMNKGLEVIEAAHLFQCQADQIEIVVHPQSIIHSFVQFHDGSLKAQLGVPNMRLPILYALSFPYRIHSDLPRVDTVNLGNLTLEKPDLNLFRCPVLAYDALRAGGTMPCILNAANEIAVQSFIDGKISFLNIANVIEQCMLQQSLFVTKPTMDDYFAVNQNSRIFAQEIINKYYIT